jgi:hypothetical protein
LEAFVMDIEANLATYLAARTPTDRYASFDYCFNYFQSHLEDGRVSALVAGPGLQFSCLHLGFYLASWGMLRGSTVLLRRSLKHLVPAIQVIATSPREVWVADANDYSDDSCKLILDVSRRLRAAFPEGASDTLVTKIMLGVFGCVPAFDTNFRNGFGVSTFGLGALRRVGHYYEENAEVIERHRVPTLDFDTGASTARIYSRAKVIDMIFFVEGGQ